MDDDSRYREQAETRENGRTGKFTPEAIDIMKPRRYKAALKDFFYQSGRGTGKGSASDQQIRFVIRFDGRIDLARLERSLHIIPNIDPVLGCRFVETGPLKGYWERREDLDGLCLCEVVETEDSQAALSEFVGDLHLPDDAPLFKVRVVRTAVGDTFCLRVDHRLGDGGGVKAIAHLIADTYRRIGTDTELQTKGKIGRFRKRTVIGLTNYHGPVQAPERKGFAFNRPFFIPKTDFRNEDAVYALRIIEPEDFLRLKALGKERGATINDLILTALARALQPFSRATEDEGFSIQVSSDFRSRLPKAIPDPICNLFGAHFPELRYHPGESFETTLKTVTEAMTEFRRNFTLENAIRDEIFFFEFIRSWARELGWPPYWPGDIPTHIILSNFTTQDETRLNFGIPIKEVLQLGTVSLGKEFMLCASTFRNRLTLSNGYCRSDMDVMITEGIMDRVTADLLSF